MKSSESYPLTVDFSTISACGTLAASNARGSTGVKAYLNGTDVSDTLIVTGSVAYSGQQLQAQFHNGTAGETYFLEYTACDDAGQKYVERLRLKVTE